jgi:hypothetical protein
MYRPAPNLTSDTQTARAVTVTLSDIEQAQIYANRINILLLIFPARKKTCGRGAISACSGHELHSFVE